MQKKTGRKFFHNLDIVASNDINEKSLESLNQTGHAISVFGIGTNLVTCQAQPALGCVYKLVQLNGTPRIKLSNDLIKVLLPSCKKAFRLYGKDGYPIKDILIEADEEDPQPDVPVMCRNPYDKNKFEYVKAARIEALHDVVWDKSNGLGIEIPTLDASRKVAEKEKKSFHPSITALKNPRAYEVTVSEKLYEELHRMWNESRSSQ